MGRFAEVYTPEQRDAITTAILDHDMTAPAACAAAAAGQLGLSPFTMKVTTARHYAREARKRRLLNVVTQGTSAAVTEYTARLVRIAHLKTLELEQQGAKAPTTEAIQVAKLVQELAKLDAPNKTPKPSPTKGEKTPSAPPDTTASFLNQLAADLPHPEPPHTNDGVGDTATGEHHAHDAPQTSTHNPSPTTGEHNGVSVRATDSARRAGLAQVGQQLG